jgi:hypothetical protein
MTDTYRDSFSNRYDDERNGDPGARWRRGEDRYRREASAQGDHRFDEDRYQDNRRNRDFGYGRAYRDDDYGGRGGYGRNDWREQRYGGGREFDQGGSGRHEGAVTHWHERDHDRRAGHPYSGTYGGTGDSSYFTGSQGSWAVAPVDRPQHGFYGGGQGFGADYRSHGYGGGRDADDDGRRGFWDRASDEVASWFGDEDAARRREQDHRGRGPKDYVRSDERIRDDANDRLTDDWQVDASNITVAVENGEITLNGTVSTRAAKRRAEDVVDSISGVKHVQNNLRVQETTSAGTYGGNWTSNRASTAEGGVASQSATEAGKQNSKV